VQLLLIELAGAIAVIAVLDAALKYAREYLLKSVGQKVAFRLRAALYAQIHRLSLTFHDQQRTGDLLTRVTKDVDKVQEFLADNVVDAAANVLKLAGMLGIMCWLDWQLSLIMLAFFPLLWLTVLRFRR